VEVTSVAGAITEEHNDYVLLLPQTKRQTDANGHDY
jgi:hypothetical protein